MTEEVIEKVEQIAGYELRQIMGHGYPCFDMDPWIEINETMANDEE